MKNKEKTVALLLIIFLALCAAGIDAFAGATVKTNGLFKGVDDDGRLNIDEHFYLLSPSAHIADSAGRPKSVRELKPPLYVSYEFEYTKNGAVITLLRERVE